MDSSYYQPIFIESPGLLVLAGARRPCDDFLKKVLKANSKGNESVIELTQTNGSPVLAAVYKNRLLPR
jgi:uncharacterized protein involved in exopolysaccharide biosynthesis